MQNGKNADGAVSGTEAVNGAFEAVISRLLFSVATNCLLSVSHIMDLSVLPFDSYYGGVVIALFCWLCSSSRSPQLLWSH